jgi:hypothetical protein
MHGFAVNTSLVEFVNGNSAKLSRKHSGFWRYFHFSQLTDAKASPNFEKEKSHPK